jgi:hypothetical protein
MSLRQRLLSADAATALRRWRRTTLLGPIIEAWWIRAILRHISGSIYDVRVCAPEQFSPYLRQLTILSPYGALPTRLEFDYIILQQDYVTSYDLALLAPLRTHYTCIAANRRFALFNARTQGRQPVSHEASVVEQRIEELCRPRLARSARMPVPRQDRAILVTTHNRPAGLTRSLPQLVALGYYVVVVDDGSKVRAAEQTRQICAGCGADLIALPDNRGLSAALNIGLNYLLADSRFEWISYFQDDVDVAPELMSRLRLVEDASNRPLLTGYDAARHAAEGHDEINGVAVKLKRSTGAVHLHGHADYWRQVLPIPTQYLGAPKRRWDASLADYWIVNNAPGSLGARNLPIVCVPNLVRSFLWHAADSTWNNPGAQEPPLAPAR